MWLDEFKIAVASEDIGAIEELCDKMPSEFNDAEEMSQATELIAQAINLTKQSKANLSKELEKLKNVQRYISS